MDSVKNIVSTSESPNLPKLLDREPDVDSACGVSGWADTPKGIKMGLLRIF